MSMSSYSVHDYGLVLNNLIDDLQNFQSLIIDTL